MKRVLLWFAVIALIGSSTSVTASAAVKAGGACTKVKATTISNGYKYTCVKSGKKLIWSKGVKVVVKATPNPTPSATPAPSPASYFPKTSSYLDNSRTMNGAGGANNLGANMAAITVEEQRGTRSGSLQIKVISPVKGGVSFDSGILDFSADSFTLFVEGTICFVIYRTEVTEFSGKDGTGSQKNWAVNEGPRAESGNCPPFGTVITPGPITLPKEGLQIVKSNLSASNDYTVSFKAVNFKSYQISLESQLNSDVLWESPIKNGSQSEITENVGKLKCDTLYNTRVKLWSEPNGTGKLISNIRRHYISSYPCGKPASTPKDELKEGGFCGTVGSTFITSEGTFLCRRVVNDKNTWILYKKNESFPNQSNVSLPIDTCKLTDKRVSDVPQTLNNSFPRPDRFKPSTGVVNVALTGIDFSDAPGKGLPFDRAPGLIKYFNEWFDFYSGGKMKLKWFEVNKWLRVDALSTDFNQKTNPFTAVNLMNTKVFGALEPLMPLETIPLVLIYFPEQLDNSDDGYMPFRGGGFKLANGTMYEPYYWGGDPYAQPITTYYLHEILHGIGFTGHAPLNGGPFGILMNNQDSKSYGIDVWSGFINNWYDKENIVCLDKANLEKSEFKLESIDTNPKGVISGMVKLNDKEILVIEPRRQGKFSTFADGFAGVTVYKVDTSKVYARWDRELDGFDFEKNQWAYYLRTDQQKSPEWVFTQGTSSRIVAYPGESFTIDGVRITYKESGNFDTVIVEKVS